MFSFGKLFRSASWKTAHVQLGSSSFKIPYTEIVGKHPGKTMLITGGMDGDEYAGMEAVYTIYEKYVSGNFSGRLRLVPIINIPGFQAECSQNPLDQKFPKYFFPGRANGSPTEQLIHWLYTEHIQEADVWYDGHGGAITEGMKTFLWVFRTGTAHMDLLSQELIAYCSSKTTVLSEWSGFGYKASRLARKGCHYVIGESGARGTRTEDQVNQHIEWIESLMRVHGMLEEKARPKTIPEIYHHVSFVFAPYEGIWSPAEDIGEKKIGRQEIGTCMRIDGSSAKKIHAPKGGMPLWWKETMAMRKGDILMAIGW